MTDKTVKALFKNSFKERRSNKQLLGMPLWHIGKKAEGFIAIGLNACGVISIGLSATGVLSFGMLSAGLLSFGLLSFGLFSFGVFAPGLLAAGCISVGVISAGAVCIGIISAGAVSIGDFSVGALAIGKYFAKGDSARAMIAIGDTEVRGELFEKLGELTADDAAKIKELLDANVPQLLQWAKNIIIKFMI